MNKERFSKCPTCNSLTTKSGAYNFVFATTDTNGFYCTEKWTCSTCGWKFENVYRCDYLITRWIQKDIKNHDLNVLGKEENYPKCNNEYMTTYLKGFCYNHAFLGGTSYQRKCSDCQHIYDRIDKCEYKVMQGPDSIRPDWGTDKVSAKKHLRCPSCDSQEIKPYHNGLHLDTHNQYGIYITIECLKCKQIFQEIFKCTHIETRKTTSEFDDFHGRFLSDIEIYLCQNCYFSWTDEYDGKYGHMCPLCNDPEPYPVNQGN